MVYYKHSELRPDELVIEMLYTGLCHSDFFKLDCAWRAPESSPWPMVAGHEIVGKVLRVGSGVTHFMPGDLVGACPHRNCCGFCSNCKSGNDNLCMGAVSRPMYDPYFGGYAT